MEGDYKSMKVGGGSLKRKSGRGSVEEDKKSIGGGESDREVWRRKCRGGEEVWK